MTANTSEKEIPQHVLNSLEDLTGETFKLSEIMLALAYTLQHQADVCSTTVVERHKH